MNYADIALEQIEAATDLSGAQYRTARRLLDIVQHTNDGHVKLMKPTVLGLCGTDSGGTMRAHLGALQSAGVLHYSINGNVAITFEAWPTWENRAQKPQNRAQTDTNFADPPPAAEVTQNFTPEIARETPEIARETPEIARETPEIARTYTHAHAELSGVELSIDLDQDPDQVIPNSTQPLTPSREWTVDLLTDPAIDLQPGNAKDIARLHTPAYVVKHVATWWLKRREESPGVLVYRLLRSRRRCRPNPHPSDEFLQSDFWRTHYDRAPDEIVEALPVPVADENRYFAEGVVIGL